MEFTRMCDRVSAVVAPFFSTLGFQLVLALAIFMMVLLATNPHRAAVPGGAVMRNEKRGGMGKGVAKFLRFAVLLAFTVAISYDNAISGLKLAGELIRGRADNATNLIENHPIGRSVYLLEEFLALPLPEVGEACHGLAGAAVDRIADAVFSGPRGDVC